MNANFTQRLRALLLGWGTTGVVYGLCGYVAMHRAAAALPETWLDRHIAFSSAGIWMYLSFFALVPLAYFLTDARRLHGLRAATQITSILCGLVFLAYPTTLAFPPITGTSLAADVLRWLAQADSNHNCLPSLHGALTVLAAWALLESKRPFRSLLVLAWGLAILYATIQTRRHLAVDLGAGVLVGLACGPLGWRPWPRPADRRLDAGSLS